MADLLKRYTLPRRVDSSGKVTIYKRNHYVGTAYQGRTVYTSFDPLACEWIFRDEHGTQLRTKPAEELTPESIRALAVTDHHGKTS